MSKAYRQERSCSRSRVTVRYHRGETQAVRYHRNTRVEPEGRERESMYGSLQDAELMLRELTKRFNKNEKIYRSSAYNEESTRAEFINPFFTAMGWDLANTSGA